MQNDMFVRDDHSVRQSAEIFVRVFFFSYLLLNSIGVGTVPSHRYMIHSTHTHTRDQKPFNFS